MKSYTEIIQEMFSSNKIDKSVRAALNTSRSALAQIDSIITDLKKGKLTDEQASKMMLTLRSDVITALQLIRKADK